MRFLFLLCWLLFTNTYGYASKGVKKIKSPIWIEKITYDSDSLNRDSGSSQYLLIDQQDNLVTQEKFRHYAIKLFNSDGIQEHSNININFDPTYQTLSFHYIRIIRDGKTLDKLSNVIISTIQRETDMESALFDGSLTAVINLKDIRAEDVLEYAYTLKGFNPIRGNQYYRQFYQDYTVPVNRIYCRLLLKHNYSLNIKYYNDAVYVKEGKYKNLKTYTFDVSALKAKTYDNNVPSWYDIQRSVSFSNFSEWNEVINWALPLYDDDKVPNAISKKLASFENLESKIDHCIALVQNEVRYLGLESGIGAYKPNSPSTVYKNRYGDCKDKSLLLVSALRSIGIEAFPFLVNTTYGPDLLNWQPSASSFDHCVVSLTYKDKDYFIDPTISNQKGSFKTLAFPNYGYGLKVKRGQNELTKIPETNKSTLNVFEEFYLDSIGGGASYSIRSTYTGRRADYMRGNAAQSSIEELGKSYLNYYSEMYSEIEIDKPLNIIDTFDYTENKLILEESYRIKNLWQKIEGSEVLQFEVFPLMLDSELNFPNSAERTMPFSISTPFTYIQNTEVHMPSDWPFEESKKSINNPYFTYNSSTINQGKSIYLDYYYEVKKKLVQPEDYATFQRDLEKINNDLNFQITYDKSLEKGNLNFFSAFLLCVSLLISFFIARKIYTDYNPKAFASNKNKNIGGWMVLPLIGLFVSPISFVYRMFNDQILEQSSINLIDGLEGVSSYFGYLVYTFDILYYAFMIIFCGLLILLFFQKRTSLPNLIILFYIINVIGPIVDIGLWYFVSPEVFPTSLDEILSLEDSGIISFLIWGSYFFLSVRVKKTFVTYHEDFDPENKFSVQL